MTQENKELLLRDLCSRLTYGVKGIVYAETTNGEYDINGDLIFFNTKFNVELDSIDTSAEEIHVVAIGNEDTINFMEEQQKDGTPYVIDEFIPYLRPMSSMTKEEKKELGSLSCEGNMEYPYGIFFRCQDWLNAHHFDYRGLIPMKLALEAPEGIYNLNK